MVREVVRGRRLLFPLKLDRIYGPLAGPHPLLCSQDQRSVLSREALRRGNSAARRWLSDTRKHGRSLEDRPVTGR